MASVTIEQAAQNALATWLTAKLPDVVVSAKWPDAAFPLPSPALTILRAGDREDELTQPERVAGEDLAIHVAITSKITTVAAQDQSTANALLNACKASWNAHRVDMAAHASADPNAVVAPDAADLASSIALANELRGDINAHLPSSTFHQNADGENAIAAAAATDLASVVTLANAVKRAANAHYAARIFTWRIRACRQRMQLDVWAAYEAVRDDVLARLEPALNATTLSSAGVGDRDPRNGVLVALGDGWGGYADFEFGEPRLTNTADAQQRNEFRAIYRGIAELDLRVRAQSARMVQIKLRQTLSEQSPAPAGIGTEVATVKWSSTAPGYTETFTTE